MTDGRREHAASRPGSEYDFLVGRLVDRNTMEAAIAEADALGVLPHEVLIAAGLITPARYAEALSEHILREQPSAPKAGAVLIDAARHPPGAVAAMVAALERQSRSALIAHAGMIDWSEPRAARTRRVREAALGLRRARPELSAGVRAPTWQLVASMAAPGVVAGGLLVLPDLTLAALTTAVTLPFLFVVMLRVVALLMTAAPRETHAAEVAISDRDLPTYAILVPLYREAEILPQLVSALAAIDYPAPKLDIMLVLESDDVETLAAASAMALPARIRVVEVPVCAPRTKPKALNYALRLTRADYVVVYDAEDLPEPDQLRRAQSVFRAGGGRLACVQAQLNIYNHSQSWLTRQFTLEYSALFDALLPALVRLGVPVPLGGTSNHFPRRVLDELGGWDPHNVTEDADLGVRIARAGGRVAVLASTTYEEAPPRLGIWFPQRTRWLKGWMQTFLVHMRDPRRLHADLGTVGFVGFQVMFGGVILSALAHPLFAGLLLYEYLGGRLLAAPGSLIGELLLVLSAFNLVVGYASGMALATLATTRRGRARLALDALLMPCYWLLISCAAYRALLQLLRNPYLWEKTTHSPRAGKPG